MNNETCSAMSPLCCSISRDGLTVHIDIHEDDERGWILGVIDDGGNATVWTDRFDTCWDALDKAMLAIREEGIGSFIGGLDYELADQTEH